MGGVDVGVGSMVTVGVRVMVGSMVGVGEGRQESNVSFVNPNVVASMFHSPYGFRANEYSLSGAFG